jgi:AraC family transcriptional activator of pyochelin receptor
MQERIDVSPEMITLVGDGPADPAGWPDAPVLLRFRRGGFGVTVELLPDPSIADAATGPLVFLVASEACRRLFAAERIEAARWYLPAGLAAVEHAISVGGTDPAGTALRLAKSIELLCGVFGALAADTLVPAAGDGRLGAEDAERIVGARCLIDERWREPLTIDTLARACGINRAKLTRGFRELFGCSIADAIADRRLSGARDLLLATPLPVSSIGYQCGYQSNASFTRAFTRRYGVPPTRLRQYRLAA